MLSIVYGVLFNMWIGYVILVIFLAAGFESIISAIVLARKQARGLPSNIGLRIDRILILASLMPFVTCAWAFFSFAKALSIIPTAGTGDAKILLTGLGDLLMPVFLSLALFSFFITVWVILRRILRHLC